MPELLERPASVDLMDDCLDVRAIRDGFGLSQAEFARMGAFAVKSISNWENSQPLSPSALVSMRQLKALQEALCRALEPGSVGLWLRRPNPYFEGSTPLQLIERGDVARIWRVIYSVEFGEAG